MVSRWAYCLMFPVLLWPHLAESSTYEDEDGLRKALFSNYTKQIRPLLDQSHIVFIYANFTVYSIQHLNSKGQILTTSANLALRWENELLTWNRDDYGGIDYILVLPSQVWIPDIVVYNGANGHNFMGSDEYLVRLCYDGTTFWYPGSVLETQCSIEIAKYPFDTQTCSIEFSLWMNPAAQVQLISESPNADTALFTENGEWEMVNNSLNNATINFEAPYSFLKANFNLKRRIAYHVINTVLPILILSILNVLVFVLPPEAGEKMSLSITVLLAYAVFLSIINENMPAISTSVSILAVYMVLILALGTLSTFISVVVLHYAYTEDGRQRRFFSLACIRNSSTHVTYEKDHSPVFVTNSSNHAEKDKDTGAGVHGPKHEPAKEQPTSFRDYQSSLINPNTRNIVDKIDVISFWLFLAITVLLFVIIVSVLSAPST